MRVAPYYRVSRKDKERGVSIEIQQDVCEPYGHSRKYIFIDPYVDDGKSAYTENLAKRPAFQRLLADAKRNLFDAVLVYKFDRFSRKMTVALNAIDELLAAGVDVVSATELTEYKTAAGDSPCAICSTSPNSTAICSPSGCAMCESGRPRRVGTPARCHLAFDVSTGCLYPTSGLEHRNWPFSSMRPVSTRLPASRTH